MGVTGDVVSLLKRFLWVLFMYAAWPLLYYICCLINLSYAEFVRGKEGGPV